MTKILANPTHLTQNVHPNFECNTFWNLIEQFIYSTYAERRSGSETAIECALIILITLSLPIIPADKAPRCNCCMQSIKCECSLLDINNSLFFEEISQIVSY